MGTHDGAPARSTSSDCDWVQAHTALSRLSRQRAALDAEEGRWLLRAWRSAAHVHLGYGSFAQYVESLFGYKPRTTQEKLRVAEALEELPRLAKALESGALSWSAARELTRVALPNTESAWLDAAQGKTLRELEALVASRVPGDAPDAPATESPRPRVLRFEVAPDTFATFREAVQHLQRSAGASLNDDDLLLAMARHVLGGPRDDGRSSYQLSLHVCATCGSGAQPAAGELVPVDAAVVDMAACDAQHLGELVPLAARSRAANENASLHAIPLAAADRAHDALAGRSPPAERSAPAERCVPTDEHTATPQSSIDAHVDAPNRRERDATPQSAIDAHAGTASGREHTATPQSSIDAHAGAPSQRERDAIPQNAIDAHAGTASGREHTTTPQSSIGAHVDAPSRRDRHASANFCVRPSVVTDTTPPKRAASPDGLPCPRPRARQSLPPALRRAVLARDKHHCRVPRCAHATFMDVHHVQPRAEGGRHEAANLVTLCGAHHRAAHRGELLIERDVDGALVFRHADGSAYGSPTAPRLIEAHAKVFSALRQLGFREGEVKTVLSELRGDAKLEGATVERLLREALCRIRQSYP